MKDKLIFVRTKKGYDIHAIVKEEGITRFKRIGKLSYSSQLDEWVYIKAWIVNQIGADGLEQISNKLRLLDGNEVLK